jgi:hypothetical protein
MSTLTGRIDQLETNRPKTNDANKGKKEVEILDNDYFVYRDGDINERVMCERTLHRRLQHNHIGMEGNVNNDNHRNCGNVNSDDP